MITKLIKEQEAQIPVYIEKWVNKASEPIDRVKTVKITKELFGEDKTVLIADSIKNAIDIIQLIANGKKIEYSSQLDSQLRSQLYPQLDSQLYSQLYSQLNSQLELQLGSQLELQLRLQLHSQLNLQLHSQLRSQLNSQLHSQLELHLRSQLYSQIYSQLHSKLRSQLRSQLHLQLDSQLSSKNIAYSYYTTLFWYDWYGYYDYAKSIGVQFDEEKFNRMGEIILNIPLIITLGNILIVIDKPKCRWSNAKLHSETLPAIEWKDGTGIYLLNAVRFDEELFKKVTSGTMPFEEILAIPDIDQRTQAMKFSSVEKFIEHTQGTLLDSSKRGNKLYKIPKEADIFTVDAYFLVYSCPSTAKVYMSGVPEEIGKDKDADVAMAWKHNLSKEAYELLTVEA